MVATADSKALYVVGSDKKLKELEEVGGTGTQVTKELDTGVLVNSIALPTGRPAVHAGPGCGRIPMRALPAEPACCACWACLL